MLAIRLLLVREFFSFHLPLCPVCRTPLFLLLGLNCDYLVKIWMIRRTAESGLFSLCAHVPSTRTLWNALPWRGPKASLLLLWV